MRLRVCGIPELSLQCPGVAVANCAARTLLSNARIEPVGSGIFTDKMAHTGPNALSAAEESVVFEGAHNPCGEFVGVAMRRIDQHHGFLGNQHRRHQQQCA